MLHRLFERNAIQTALYNVCEDTEFNGFEAEVG
jgi:hypothetical protein